MRKKNKSEIRSSVKMAVIIPFAFVAANATDKTGTKASLEL